MKLKTSFFEVMKESLIAKRYGLKIDFFVSSYFILKNFIFVFEANYYFVHECLQLNLQSIIRRWFNVLSVVGFCFLYCSIEVMTILSQISKFFFAPFTNCVNKKFILFCKYLTRNMHFQERFVWNSGMDKYKFSCLLGIFHCL